MILRPLVKGLLFTSFLTLAGKVAHKATDGFAMTNIASPKYEKTLSAPPISDEAQRALDQPFTYLNCGAQSYVFLSADNNYVIKFFKFQHMRLPPFLDFLPLPKKLQEKRERKRQVYQDTMQSVSLAFEHMREETGLLYAHLAPSTRIGKLLSIRDKIGCTHTVDLDRVEFILQKRATLAFDQIDLWMSQGDIDRAEQGVQDLLSLAKKRCLKGIFDKDPDFQTNFGFVDGKAVEIDTGRFARNDSEKNPSTYEPELKRISDPFFRWIEKRHPQLARRVL